MGKWNWPKAYPGRRSPRPALGYRGVARPAAPKGPATFSRRFHRTWRFGTPADKNVCATDAERDVAPDLRSPFSFLLANTVARGSIRPISSNQVLRHL